MTACDSGNTECQTLARGWFRSPCSVGSLFALARDGALAQGRQTPSAASGLILVDAITP
jgi:hypothetical protein